MKNKSLQGAFNRIWNHFIVNGSPPGCDTKRGGAVYQDDRGNYCAVGVLMTKKELATVKHRDLLHYNVDLLRRMGVLGAFSEEAHDFLWHVQKAHDDSIDAPTTKPRLRKSFKGKLKRIAKRFSLKIPAEAQ